MIEASVIICYRTSMRVFVVDGSSKTQCEECKAEVWIAPSSREIKAKSNGRVVCDQCGQKYLTPGSVVVPFLQEQLQEINDTLANRKRRN